MVYLFSGTPGSGKSLHQAEDIYYNLKYGRPVIANFDINTELIKPCRGQFTFVDNFTMCPAWLIKYSYEYFKNHRFAEGTIKLYIDECQLMFNAREWDKNGRKEWLSFFTQHRKYGYDIYLIAQFDRMIDRQIRSLIEYEVIHRKVSNYGIYGKIMSLFAGGNLFVAVSCWYPMKPSEKVGSKFFRARKKYYQLYDTYKHFDVDDTPPN